MIVARLAIPYAGRQPSKITLGNSQRRLGDYDLSAVSQYVGTLSNAALIAVPGYVAYLVTQLGGSLSAAAQAQLAARKYMLSAGSSWNLGGLADAIRQAIGGIADATKEVLNSVADMLAQATDTFAGIAATAGKVYAAAQIAAVGIGGYLLYSLLSD